MREYQRATGIELTGPMIAEAASAGKKEAVDALASLAERLARGLALVIDILDPDVIVIGGGVSQNASIYPAVRAALPRLVFGGTADTPVLQAKHGDSSGVRGAAWLWPPMAG
jgi:fructokinase